MAGIKVALELDDRKYQQALKNATAAADTFAKTVSNSASTAGNSMQALTARLDTVNGAMGKLSTFADGAAGRMSNLATAIAGVGLAAFIGNLLQSASAVKDIGEGFGITTQRAVELDAGFAKAGRSTDQLTTAMATFASTIEAARGGSAKAQVTLEKLGLTAADVAPGAEFTTGFQKAAKAMADANGNTELLTASYDAFGKAAKGLNWGDVVAGMEGARGKSAELAGNIEKLDATQKQLENSAKNLKNAMINLLGPYAEEFNKFIGNANNAKLAVAGLATAMAVIAGGAIVNGIKALLGVVTGLAGAFGLSAAATTAETGAIAANTAALAANNSLRAAGLAARVATLESSIAVARATMAEAASEAELAAARAVLERITWRLVVAQGALAEATAAATAGTVAAGTATAGAGAAAGAAATGFAAFTAAALGALRAIALFVTRIGLVVAAVLTVNEVVKAAFSVDPIDFFAGKLEKLVKENFPALYDILEKIGAWFGMAPGKMNAAANAMAASANKTTETFKRLGIEPSSTAGAGRGGQGGPTAEQATTAPSTPTPAGGQWLKPWLAQEAALKSQYDLQKLQNEEAQKRLALQVQLVGLGDAEKTARLAVFDAESKRTIEVAKQKADIAKMELQISQGGEEAAKTYGGQLKIMKDQLAALQNQKDTTASNTAELARQNDLLAMSKVYTDMQAKAKAQVRDIDSAIADFNRSEDDRKLAAIQKQIDAEAELAIKKRQEQLGNVPIGEQERLDIIKKTADAYDPLIAKQKELNKATAENAARQFATDLQNNAIADAIKMQGELAKLTQNSDQQRITDLNTQIELLARQEIVRRQALLKPGQTLGKDEQANIRKQVFDANKGLIDSTQAVIDKSREFSTGWESSFNQYKSDAFNAANEAKTYFDTFSKGFEDAFVRMVTTGKLSFKDLANSLIADFARIQAKKLLTGVFDMGGGSGGFGFGTLFSSIGKIFGFANGGNPPVGKVSLVGERGPELFVPKVAGTIVPNEMLGGGVSQTSVTYNIQAVDAQSFKSMVARDPQFLYAVTEQGRRSLPGRR